MRSRRFDLVGLRGRRRAPTSRSARAAAAGAGARGCALAVHGDHAPDTGAARRASDPVWTGAARRAPAARCAAARPAALRVHFVRAVPAARRAPRSAARCAARPRAGRAGAGAGDAAVRRDPRASLGRRLGAAARAAEYGDVQVAFVHHTVTANDYGPRGLGRRSCSGSRSYHRDTNGWNDIGYNFLVDQYGQVFEGRAGGIDQAVVGAQAQGYNSHSTGVAVPRHVQPTVAPPSAGAGGARPPDRLEALAPRRARARARSSVVSGGGDRNRYRAGTRVTLQRICGHRDGDATSCPGDGLYAPARRSSARAARRYAFTPDPATAGDPAHPRRRAGRRSPTTARRRSRGRVVRADGQPTAGLPVQVQRRGRTRLRARSRGRRRTATAPSRCPSPGTSRATSGSRSWARSAPWCRSCACPRSAQRRSVRRVGAGGVVRVRGGVRPAVAVTVLVERKGPDGRWRRSRAVRATVRRGRYSAAVLLPAPGLYRLTAKAGTPAAHRAATPQYVRALRRR